MTHSQARQLFPERKQFKPRNDELCRREIGVHAFNIDDLIHHSAELVKETKDGKTSLLVENNEPVAAVLFFSETMLKEGMRVALAMKLFDGELVSVGQAAKLAELLLALFMESCSALGIPVARYESGEVEQELRVMEKHDHR